MVGRHHVLAGKHGVRLVRGVCAPVRVSVAWLHPLGTQRLPAAVHISQYLLTSPQAETVAELSEQLAAMSAELGSAAEEIGMLQFQNEQLTARCRAGRRALSKVAFNIPNHAEKACILAEKACILADKASQVSSPLCWRRLLTGRLYRSRCRCRWERK